MRHAALLLCLTVLSGAPLAHAEPPRPSIASPVLSQGYSSSLLSAYPKGGEGLTQSVADLLVRDPAAAPFVAALGANCNCDQATAIALGVSRATKLLQQASPAAIKPMYRSFVDSCAGCRRRVVKGPVRPEDERCLREGDPARQRLADVLKVRAPQGKDCLCALLSSLATQALAQGQAGTNLGFFPDEGGFIGGGIGFPGSGAPVSGN